MSKVSHWTEVLSLIDEGREMSDWSKFMEQAITDCLAYEPEDEDDDLLSVKVEAVRDE